MTTSSTTNKDLAAQIGDVREQLGAVLAETRHASQGRQVLHEKLDRVLDIVQTQAIAIASATKDAALATATAAQTRDRVDAFDREITPAITELKSDVSDLKNANSAAAPLLDTIRQARNLLTILVVIAGASGIGLVGVLTFFNEAARGAFRTWLGI